MRLKMNSGTHANNNQPSGRLAEMEGGSEGGSSAGEVWLVVVGRLKAGWKQISNEWVHPYAAGIRTCGLEEHLLRLLNIE